MTASGSDDSNLIAFPHAKADGRVRVDGKYFRVDGGLWVARGVAYGPFGPGEGEGAFASVEQTTRDFDQMRSLGLNTVRIYHVPPLWFLDLAQAKGLRVWVDLPWDQHRLFLEHVQEVKHIRRGLVQSVSAFAHHPALFTVCVGNEISSELIRWQGGRKVARFLDDLVDDLHQKHQGILCTYGNFPPTEYFCLEEIDFLSYNIYLHEAEAMDRYLARLQLMADGKPLVVGELGMDTLTNGPKAQADYLSQQLALAERHACAGVVVFGFTDDWVKDGEPVTDWAFGITDANRKPKPACDVLKSCWAIPERTTSNLPFVSVVIAAYNAADTLGACLASLEKLAYPNYEVIIVDDGSNDNTRTIAARFSSFKYIDLGTNRGLSAARNAGIRAAKGEIVAFTDADCQADAQWLRFLVAAFEQNDWAAVGGPNLLPPDDGYVAAAVMATPGGPAHVMLTDRIAEHIPGCNMAFRADALRKVGCFDPQFRVAGDDVDLCWRFLKRDMTIGFAPGAFVWHHRRSTIGAFIRQQMGYGRAESLLFRKYPSMFNAHGDHVWHGRIYAERRLDHTLGTPRVYHGLYGYAPFQPLYGGVPSRFAALLTSFDYHLQTTFPLLMAGTSVPFLGGLAWCNLMAFLMVGIWSAAAARIPKDRRKWWGRFLLIALHLAQPMARSLARLQQWTRMRQTGNASRERMEAMCLTYRGGRFDRVSFWNETSAGRPEFFAAFRQRLAKLPWDISLNTHWDRFDAWLPGGWCFDLQVFSVDEYFKDGKRRVSFRLDPKPTFMARTWLFWLLGVGMGLAGFFGVTVWCLILQMGLAGGAWMAYRHLRQKLLAECLVELVETADTLGWTLMTDSESTTVEQSNDS